MPLSTIRDGHDPRDWSRRSDRLTAVALTEYEASLCPDCGQPKHRAYNPDINGFYDVVEVQCQGCQAVHEYVAGNKDLTPDVKVAVVDTYDERELGPLRPMPPLATVSRSAPPTDEPSIDATLGGAS